ncbi:MAG: methylmalonyl-CoA epimerase [bacterium]
MVNRIDHIGIAVNSIEEQLPYYQDILGLEIQKIETVASEGVKVCFIAVGDTHIELLEPISDESPIKKFLEKNGQGVHHIAYATDDIVETVVGLKGKQFKLINEQPKQGAGGKLICFVHPKSTFGVLTEICQGTEIH